MEKYTFIKGQPPCRCDGGGALGPLRFDTRTHKLAFMIK